MSRSLFSIYKGVEEMEQHQYINSDQTVFGDAYAMMRLNKNILLKGPTGSGKTKLAETLSNEINIPMHQVNCSCRFRR